VQESTVLSFFLRPACICIAHMLQYHCHCTAIGQYTTPHMTHYMTPIVYVIIHHTILAMAICRVKAKAPPSGLKAPRPPSVRRPRSRAASQRVSPDILPNVECNIQRGAIKEASSANNSIDLCTLPETTNEYLVKANSERAVLHQGAAAALSLSRVASQTMAARQ